MEAEIVVEYDDARIAEAIARAVSPDNSGTPKGLLVRTRREKKKVVTSVKCCQGFSTFVATIDDLLFSIATAEKTLRETVKLKTQASVQSRCSSDAGAPACQHAEGSICKKGYSQSFRKHSLW